MKKLMFIVATMIAVSFAACGNKTTASANAGDSTTVDSTTVVDTVATDSVVAE